MGAFRPGWTIKGNGAHYQIIPNQAGNGGAYGRPQPGVGAPGQLPIIAPRPLPPDLPEEFHIPPQQTATTQVAEGHRASNAYTLQTPSELPTQAPQAPQRRDTSSTVVSNVFSAGPTTGSSASSNSYTVPSGYGNEVTDSVQPALNSNWSQTPVPKHDDFYRSSHSFDDVAQDQTYTKAEPDFHAEPAPYHYAHQLDNTNPTNIQNPTESQTYNMQHNVTFPTMSGGYHGGNVNTWSNQTPVQNFSAQGMQCSSEVSSASSCDYGILVASIYQYADDCPVNSLCSEYANTL